MATVHDLAICIRHWDYSETSQTVSLFGREQGVFQGLAKGARRERSNFSGGIDLLTLGHVVAIIKPGRELSTLTEWGLSKVWWRARRDRCANQVAWYLADCVGRSFDQHDPHQRVFDALVAALDALEEGTPESRVLLRFQWQLLLETGFKPRLDLPVPVSAESTNDDTAILFSAREGGVVDQQHPASQHQATWRVRHETISLLQRLEKDCESTASAPVDVCDRAARLLAVYLREMLGEELQTMSLVYPDLAVGQK